MIERSLLLSAPMVLELRAGRKTQTRRLGERYRKWTAGDRLYIRETWRPESEGNFAGVRYRADHSFVKCASAEQMTWREVFGLLPGSRALEPHEIERLWTKQLGNEGRREVLEPFRRARREAYDEWKALHANRQVHNPPGR